MHRQHSNNRAGLFGALTCAAVCVLLPGLAQGAEVRPAEAELFKLLTCDIPVPLTDASAAIKHIEARYPRTVNGEILISGPLFKGDACIKEIRFGGMLGIIDVTGKVCDRRPGAFVDGLRKDIAGVRARARFKPDDIETFEAESPARRYAMRVYHGEPQSLLASRDQHTPASKALSYACAHKEVEKQ